MKEAAVGYIRVSTTMQAEDGVSLDAQEERIRAYCLMTGLDLVALVREEGVSASVALGKRPGGQEVLQLLKQLKAKHIVSLKLDRLFRDAEDALRQTRQWDKAGIALHLVDMGGQTVNTATAMGRMFLTMMAGFAELERSLIAERTAAAMNHKKAHREVYSPTPLGFERKGNVLVVNSDEQALVARIKEWKAVGWGLERIANALNSEGVPGKKGGKWYGTTIKKILANNLHEKTVA